MIHPEEAHDCFFKCWTERDRKTKKGGRVRRGKETNERKEGGRKGERKKNEERENSIYNSNSVVWFAKIFNRMSILYFLFFLQ